MFSFFREYGKTLLIIAFFVLLILAAGGMFYREWGNCGIVEDGIKPDFAGGTYDRKKSIIYAVNRRVFQDERIAVEELAEVRDKDGERMTEQVCFYNNEGERLSGMLNTSVPGKYKITVQAENPDTGQRVRKTICVLVDGRVAKGERQ